jgi:Arc/MetJ family transcription regulator
MPAPSPVLLAVHRAELRERNGTGLVRPTWKEPTMHEPGQRLETAIAELRCIRTPKGRFAAFWAARETRFARLFRITRRYMIAYITPRTEDVVAITSIDIDQDDLKQAKELAGTSSNRETVELALKTLIALRRQPAAVERLLAEHFDDDQIDAPTVTPSPDALAALETSVESETRHSSS